MTSPDLDSQRSHPKASLKPQPRLSLPDPAPLPTRLPAFLACSPWWSEQSLKCTDQIPSRSCLASHRAKLKLPLRRATKASFPTPSPPSLPHSPPTSHAVFLFLGFKHTQLLRTSRPLSGCSAPLEASSAHTSGLPASMSALEERTAQTFPSKVALRTPATPFHHPVYFPLKPIRVWCYPNYLQFGSLSPSPPNETHPKAGTF